MPIAYPHTTEQITHTLRVLLAGRPPVPSATRDRAVFFGLYMSGESPQCVEGAFFDVNPVDRPPMHVPAAMLIESGLRPFAVGYIHRVLVASANVDPVDLTADMIPDPDSPLWELLTVVWAADVRGQLFMHSLSHDFPDQPPCERLYPAGGDVSVVGEQVVTELRAVASVFAHASVGGGF